MTLDRTDHANSDVLVTMTQWMVLETPDFLLCINPPLDILCSREGGCFFQDEFETAFGVVTNSHVATNNIRIALGGKSGNWCTPQQVEQEKSIGTNWKVEELGVGSGRESVAEDVREPLGWLNQEARP
jgi:hypothetical protein